MSWYYQNELVEELPEECLGFVYLITNLTSGRMYIGKKLAKFSKTTYKTIKLKNGNKKRKKIRGTIESDWREYYGSNDQLNKDVKELGAAKFRREILYYCTSKAEMSYIEAKEQFDRRVLETDEYYNGIINCRIGGSNILRERLSEHERHRSRKE
jgi:hypothetical protein